MKSSTIKEMIENSVLLYPNNIAFYEKENKEYKGITYSELYSDMVNLGNKLIDMGLKDKNIAIIGKNSYEWGLSYLTTVCGVGKVVPLDKELKKEELDKQLNNLNVDLIIYSKEQEKKLDHNKYKTIRMQDEMKELIKEGSNLDNNYTNTYIDPNNVAVYLFTSGTTGNSKIVMLSNKNIMHNINNIDQFIKLDETDRFFSVLPMNHTLECTGGFLTPLSIGASMIHLDSLKYIQKDMIKTKPTIIIGVPRVIELFDQKITNEIEKKGKTKLVKAARFITNFVPALKRPIFKDIHESFGSDLKTIIVGGAPVDPLVSKRLREYGFTILQGYGLTECAPLVAGNSYNNFKDDKVGHPLRDTDIKVINTNSDGIGEICVKGPQVMLGYYNNEKATKEAIDEDGYFHTGDRGYVDKSGFIKIVGRCKNVIITSNGKNVYPEEIEVEINKSKYIKQAIVSAKDNIITVEIVLTEDIQQKIKEIPSFKEEITKIINEYIKEINSKLAEYKKIKKVELRDKPFEETSTQKIKRYVK